MPQCRGLPEVIEPEVARLPVAPCDPAMTPKPLPFDVEPPRDRRVLDRVRSAARSLYLTARAPVLWAMRLTRRRVPPPHRSRVSSLLVLRTDRLGDMALTTAALQDLRAHFRHATITVVAPPGPLELLEAHPAVDRRYALRPGGALPAGLVDRFDLAIDFTPDESLRGARLVARSRARFRAGFRAAGREAYFNIVGPAARRDRHVLDLNRDLLEALGIEASTTRPGLYVRPVERTGAERRLSTLGAAEPCIAVHLGAHYPSQRWDPERFADLITLLTERVAAACIVLCGPGETDLTERVCAATPDALAVSPGSVRAMMALIGSCDLFVGNNSGPLHIAGALGVPTVSVMGPTDPRRFMPRGPTDRVVRRRIACSPCDRGRCWHHTCLRTIGPEEVADEAEAALAASLNRGSGALAPVLARRGG